MDYKFKFSDEKAREMPMVDLAFEILKATNEPSYYRDLMQEIAKIKSFSDDEVMQVIAQLYTEINIDGRFACVGKNLWGLKRWYPVDKSEDGIGNTQRPRIINDEDDDEDYFSEDDVDSDNDDDFGSFDDEEEEVADEEELFDDDEIDEELDDEDLEEEDLDGDLDENLGDDEDEEDEEDEEDKLSDEEDELNFNGDNEEEK